MAQTASIASARAPRSRLWISAQSRSVQCIGNRRSCRPISLLHRVGLLDAQWPADHNPGTVPFKRRSVTALSRHGFYSNWTLFDQLTEEGMFAWWNAGPVTASDIRDTGNKAIRRHQDEAELLQDLDSALSAVESEPWASDIWHHNPRLTEFIPKGDLTIREIAASGSALDRRCLWEYLEALRSAVEVQATSSLRSAISRYMEAVSAQRSDRLEVLLARTGLDGQDPMTGFEAGRRLGVSCQRIYQIERQLHRRRPGPAPGWGLAATDRGCRTERMAR